MNKKYAPILAVIIIVAIASAIAFNSSIEFGFSGNRDNKLEDADASVAAIGKFVGENHQQFLSAIDYKADVNDKEIAFWANGLPVTSDEINFRLAVSKASGSGSQTMSDIEKVFVEYRVIEKEARELKLMPTDEEIEGYISNKMEECRSDPLSMEIMEKVIESWGLTEKEYWDVARYDAYYFLMCEKLERYYFSDFYNKDAISYEDSQQIKTMWDELISEKTSKAVVNKTGRKNQ